jgi:dehydrogenase/reductase SDR family member 7B
MALPSLLIPIVLITFPSTLAFQPISPLVCGSRTHKSSSHNQWPNLSTTQQRNFHITRFTGSINMGIGSSSSSNSINLSDTTKNTFQNKSILITGASRGLGKSLAIALSKCNPSLLILSGRDENALQQVKSECIAVTKTGSIQVEIVTCDLADKSSVEQLGDTALQLSSTSDGIGGGIDILINNGGISSRSSFLQTNINVDEQLMQVNFFSGVMLAKKLIPNMVTNQNGGKLIWISSIQGKLGTPYRTSYAASKFAVQGYCEALRSELATSNVDVHVVSPGYIRTNLSLSAIQGDGTAYSKMDSTTANGADADEVACTILTSVAKGQTDFVVAATFSAKVGLWLRFLAPNFLESMLVKRFEKGQIESKKTE